MSVADISENAVKFGIKVFSDFMIFSLLFSAGVYTIRMSSFKLLLNVMLTLQILSHMGSNSAFTSDGRIMPTPFSDLFFFTAVMI